MVNVGALDYGVHFEVHKSDIKPLVNDLSIVSIPYRVSFQKIHIIKTFAYFISRILIPLLKIYVLYYSLLKKRIHKRTKLSTEVISAKAMRN